MKYASYGFPSSPQPDYLEIDVIELKDDRDKCQECLDGFVVAKVSEELSGPGAKWTPFKKLCSECLWERYQVDIEPSPLNGQI